MAVFIQNPLKTTKTVAFWLTLLQKYGADFHEMFYVGCARPKEEVTTFWNRTEKDTKKFRIFGKTHPV